MSVFGEAPGRDCCICFETIETSKNNATTACGHTFCFQCLGLAMAFKNSCPICRAKLIEVPGMDDDDDNDDGGGGGGGGEGSERAGQNDGVETEGEVEVIVERLQSEGFTLLDVTSMLLNRYSKRDSDKWTNEHIGHINRRFDCIAAEVDLQHIEQQRFAREDTRQRSSPLSP